MAISDPAKRAPSGQRVSRGIGLALEPRVLGPLIGAAVVALALLVVHRISGQVHLNDILAAISSASPATLLPTLALTAASFAAMSFYDVLAVRRVAPGRVPMRLAVFAGLVGYAMSNALGFHVFVGGPVRYRIYQTAGLDAGDVGRIVGISFMTFSGGIAAILSVVLLLDPVGVPVLRAISPAGDRLLGLAILAALAAALLWLSRGRRQLSVLGWTFLLPSARSAVAQVALGAVDIGATAAALYVLLPPDVAPGFASFLLLFVAAIVAGIVSHAPGGLGVLEATILLGLGAGTRPDVVAALVLFRLIYYVLPLALGVLALLGFEIRRIRRAVPVAARRRLATVRRVVPPLAATLVLAGGVVLLLSGSTPADRARMGWLEDVVPLPFTEASHLLASLTGLLLIVIARGLYRRIATARLAAMALLALGAAFSLAKGLDWEEAALLAALAALMAASGPAFYRKGDWRSFRPDRTWIGLIVIVVAACTLIGLLAYRHVDYRADLWWQFAWAGDAPRFLRATLALSVLAAALAIDTLVNRPAVRPVRAPVPVPPAVRRILESSSDTQSCVALLGDKRFLVAEDATAFLMYAERGSSWITMGDPVGEASSAPALIWRFAEAADRAGAKAVFYAVRPEFLPIYLDMGLAVLKIGEVARVPLPGFTLAGGARQPLRYARGKAAREGLAFSVVPRSGMPAILPELRAVSDAWLASKTGREKGFSLGRFDEAYLSEFDCAVMRRGDRILAFANLWRSGDGQELSIDLMRYAPEAPNVTMDALFVHLLLYGQAEGYRWFNLGAAPLAGLTDHPLASTWNRIGTFIYRRGDEFYNFEGLRAFKQKFDPVWTPQYLACRGGFTLPQALLDVTTLISDSLIGALKR